MAAAAAWDDGMAEKPSEAIYEALVDDEAFARLPTLLATAAEARSGLLQWRHADDDYEILAYSYFTPEFIAKLPEVLPQDPWMIAALGQPNRMLRLDRLVSVKAFENSIPYNELIRPSGDDTARCMAMVVQTPWGTGVTSVHRGRLESAFDTDDQARMAASLRHLIPVLRVRGQLAASQRELRLAKGVAERLAFAVMTVAPDGRILTLNPAADEVVARADGLVSVLGRLTAADFGAGQRLAAAITRATTSRQPSASAVVVERDAEKPAYNINVTPLILGQGAARAMVVLRDPDFVDPSLGDRLRALFGLTEAEAAIAVKLGERRSPAEIMFERGVRPNTLSAQIKSLLGKMGCRRQAEVAAMVAALPPLSALQLPDRK